jgi:hypothetical protein
MLAHAPSFQQITKEAPQTPRIMNKYILDDNDGSASIYSGFYMDIEYK